MNFKKYLVVALAFSALTIAGCGDETTTTSAATYEGGNPTFELYGQVTDGSNQNIQDAKVSIWVDGGWKTATSSKEGMYSFGNVPYLSDVILKAEYTGTEKDAAGKDIKVPYQSTELRFQTPADDTIASGYRGNDQVELDMIVVKMNYVLKGEVYAFDKGLANGAQVVVDLRKEGFNIFKTVTATNGTFEITGLPEPILANGSVTYQTLANQTLGNTRGNDSFKYELMVLPYDSTGDGLADFGTVTADYYPTNGAAPGSAFGYGGTVAALGDMIKINLGNAYISKPEAIWANVADGVIASVDNVEIIFNQTFYDAAGKADPDFKDLVITLKDKDTGADIAFTYGIESGVKLVINPTLDKLREGREYTVTVTGDAVTYTKNFYVPFADERPVTAITGLALQDPTVKFDAATTNVNLKWAANANAEKYRIYAKDTKNNSDWVEVAEVNASTAVTGVTATASVNLAAPGLGALFDTAALDIYPVEPFSFGNTVTFGVSGVNEEGVEGPISTETLALKDTFTVLGTSLTPVLTNSVTVDGVTTRTYTVTFSEYMDVTTVPTLSSEDTVVNLQTPILANWKWSDNQRSATFTATQLKNEVATGDNMVINFTAVKDSSGNAISDNATTSLDDRIKKFIF